MSTGSRKHIWAMMAKLIGLSLSLMCIAILAVGTGESKRKGQHQDASMCKYTTESHRYCERYAGGKVFCTYERDSMAVPIDCEIVKNLFKPEKTQ